MTVPQHSLHARFKHGSVDDQRRWVRQLVEAVAVMHSHGWIHGDIYHVRINVCCSRVVSLSYSHCSVVGSVLLSALARSPSHVRQFPPAQNAGRGTFSCQDKATFGSLTSQTLDHSQSVRSPNSTSQRWE